MKKNTNKIMGMLIAILLLIANLVVSGAAANSSDFNATVNLGRGMPGSTVNVTIELKNNPGVSSLKFNVEYDEILTLTDVVFNEDFGSMVSAVEPYKNPQPISFISPFNAVNVNGVFATLSFTISENAKDGDVANIILEPLTENIIDGNDDVIDINVTNGAITVFEGIPGDINADGKVNNADAIMLFRYVAGWNVEPDYGALDCNCDGKINNADAIILFRYVAGWDVEIGRGTVCQHQLTVTNAIEATCTESGNIKYWHCEKCKKYFSDQNATTVIAFEDVVTEVKGHSIVIDSAVSPTNSTSGLTKGSHCSVCNSVLEPQKKTYLVTFKDYDDSVIKSEIVEENNDATLPDAPTRAGYTFEGWEGSYTNITSCRVITAKYVAISSETYTVTFYDYDGKTILATRSGVTANGYAAPPANPTKSNATFMGWSGNYANVTKNENVRAVYSDEKNVFTISSTSGMVGDTVKVLIGIDGTVKSCGFDMSLYYDSALELVSYDDDLDLDIVVNDSAYTNGIKLNFSSASDKTKQRDVIELTFRIKNTSKNALPINISLNSIKEIVANNAVNSSCVITDGVVIVNK